ncbi:ABC transporter ATP-binding protein [Gluconobacter oxydans]|uniref:ABC transporter ATP-binding protein n=1 Tax=Gluconobacter oxydans TaxID=442 RepID=UPI00079B12A2|nr:ABC transporter ATP-binding protein [Gluconobacter oxydans]KXV13549.1 ABC transporter ATP-binding protein [Gluconobacter oxydans]MCP1249438.1 ABC transporter ATP-binding protein [Gluconobacter oxydans]WKE47629.1 ABC transporter ATP-binding protein [Gluconobacter oxydans]
MQDRNILHPAAPSSLPVEVSHLTKSFGSFRALDDVSFSIAQGETVALLGRNGAGKSTLIGCLMGFLLADGGSIDIFGHSIAALPREIRARTGFVPQTMTGFDSFRVAQLMDYIAAFYGELPPVDPTLIAWADLDPKKQVRSLSGGQKQRLAIVLAMRHSPEFLVLDEPVASLDPHARRDFMNLLDTYTQRTGASILISSHILSDLERLCSRLLFVRQGHVVLDVPTETFRATTRWLEHPTPDRLLAALPADLQILGQRPDALLVHGWTGDLILPEGTLTVIPDFEDAFLEITAPRTSPADTDTPDAAA